MMTQFAKITAAALMTAAAIAAAPASFAGTKTATFQVSLTIQNDCSIAANPLNFGTTGLLGSNIDQSTTVSITCSTGTPYNVTLDSGSAPGSTVTERLMVNANGTATVQYNLYRDAARTQVWGVTDGTDTVSGTGAGTAQAITVYGRVPVQATPAADNYVSTVTAAVEF